MFDKNRKHDWTDARPRGEVAVDMEAEWRRHGVDWGGHVRPTFARGRS